MNKINLCEILKGYEGGKFYCSGLLEYVTLTKVGKEHIVFTDSDGHEYSLLYHGGMWYNKECDCMFWPSEDSRDWNEWLAKQDTTPKVFSDLNGTIQARHCSLYWAMSDAKDGLELTPIEKSALAILKIRDLIEIGYGGNVSTKDWNKQSIPKWVIDFGEHFDDIRVTFTASPQFYSHIAFYSEKQAKEFLKYPENVQLLKEYFML